MSVESYMLINFIMNAIIIGVIARSRGIVRWRSVFIAAAVGALYALAAQAPVFYRLNALAAKLVIPFIMAAIGIRVDYLIDIAKCGLEVLLASVFLGGVSRLAHQLFPGESTIAFFVSTALATTVLYCVTQVKMRELDHWSVQMHLKTDWGETTFRAMVDTGNRLREPLSGLPVMILDERRAMRVLPADFSLTDAMNIPPPGFRLVGYGALGGAGRMVCFRPEEVLVSFGDGWMRAPDLWIGVYPGRMPGGEGALAPAVLGRIQRVGKRKISIEPMKMERRMRR